MTTVIVTCAPPNPNGDLHVGHLSGPFLGSDVMARYLRATGRDVVHVGYIDEHSCYVPRRARELGRPPRAVAHYLGSRIEQTLALAGMSPDFCGRPHRDVWHDETIADFFRELWDRGALSEHVLPVYQCPVDGTYLYEAEIRGRCHFCGAPSDGFYCEECGRPQTSGRLADGVCTRCGATPLLAEHRRIVFPLDRYRDRLVEHYQGRRLRPRLRDYLDLMLSEPLPDTPISRIDDYGVPVPLPGWEGHILDTWFSGIWGYVAATDGARRVAGYGPGRDAWHDPRTTIHEFIGFDCSFSHALLWPAMCLELGITLPASVVTNEFYQLEGGKFSTSRGHAVWGADILADVPADSLRFYLCLTGPETERTNFVDDHFRAVTQAVLVDGLDELVRRWGRRLAEPAGEAPTDEAGEVSTDEAAQAAEMPLDEAGDDASDLLTELTRLLARHVGEHLEPEAFSPAAAADAIRAFCTDQFDEVSAAIDKADSAQARSTLALLARTVSPIMPGWAGDVLTSLGDVADPTPAGLRLTSGAGRSTRDGGRDVVPRRSLRTGTGTVRA